MTELQRQLEVTPEYWIPEDLLLYTKWQQAPGTSGSSVEAAAMILATEQGKKLNPWCWSRWRTQCKLQVNCNVRTPTSCMLYYKSKRQNLYFLSESWGLSRGKHGDRAYAKKLWTQYFGQKEESFSYCKFQTAGLSKIMLKYY